MMRFSLTCVSVLFLSSFAHATPIQLQIKGADGKPVAGAKVRVAEGRLSFRGQSFLPSRDFTSDAKGMVAFVSQGEIAASFQDINQTRVFARVTAPGLAVTGAQLKPGENTVVLSQGQSLEGVALDENEKPIPNARLSVGVGSLRKVPNAEVQFPDALKIEAVSDTQGHWKFENLPQTGWADVQVRDARFENEKFPLDLSQKAPPLFLQGGNTVKGRLLRPDGQPAAKVPLVMYQVGDISLANRQVTDANGRFTFTGLKSGSTSVQSDGSDKSLPFLVPFLEVEDLREGEVRDVGDWKSIKGDHATGKVVDAITRKPIAGAGVSIWGSGPGTGFGTCDKMGAFDLVVAPRPFLMSVGAPGYMNYSKRGVPLPQNGVIAVGTILLQAAYHAKGIVVDEAGTPMPSVQVFAEKEVTRENSSTRTNPQTGTFSLDTLENGQYTIRVPGFKVVSGATFTAERATTPSLRVVVQGKAARVPTKAAGVPTRDLPLTGRAVDGDGAPVAGVKMTFRLKSATFGRQVKNVVSQSDGSFQIDSIASTGIVQLVSTTRPGYLCTRAETVSKDDGWHADLTLLKRGGTLRGHVVDSAGRPVAGAFVGLQSGEELPVQADDKGAFTLSDVPVKGISLFASNGPCLVTMPVAKEEPELPLVLPDSSPLQNTVETANAFIENAPISRHWSKLQRVLSPSRLEARMKGKVSVGVWADYLDDIARSQPKMFLERQSEIRDSIQPQNYAQFDRLMLLCKAAVGDETQKEQVRAWLQEQEQEKREISPESVQRLLEVGEVAARLGPKEAQPWIDYAVDLNDQLNNKAGSDHLDEWGGLATRVAPDLPRTLSENWNPAAQIEIFESAMSAWREDNNVSAAQQNWATIRALAPALAKNPDTLMRNGELPEDSLSSLNEIRADYAQLIASTDPKGALEAAMEIDTSNSFDYLSSGKADVILAVARAAAQQKQFEVAREAISKILALHPRSLEAIAGAPQAAQSFDEALASSLWPRAYLAFRPRPKIEVFEEPVTLFPYIRARESVAPGESRILLEREWAKRSQLPDRPDPDIFGNQEDMASYNQAMMRRLAVATVKFSPTRALEMASSLTTKQEMRSSAQTEIALAILQSQSK